MSTRSGDRRRAVSFLLLSVMLLACAAAIVAFEIGQPLAQRSDGLYLFGGILTFGSIMAGIVAIHDWPR